MHPALIKIGPLTIHTYGALVAAGFLLGIALAVRQAKRQGMPHERIADLAFYVVVSASLGSRLFYVLMNLSYYAERPLDALKVWEGGLVFYGGLILAAAVGAWYMKSKGLPFLRTADIFAPSLAVGHAVGRLGCFSAGCCYGSPADVPWAVTFTDPEALAPLGIGLHPTQLYESGGEFLLFLVLIGLRKRKPRAGTLFFGYLLGYSALRFFTEFLRGDLPKVAGLSATQALSIVLFVVAVVMLLRLKKP